MRRDSIFDQLEPILEAAQRMGNTAWGWAVKLEVTFSSGERVPIPVAPAMALSGRHVDQFRTPLFSAKQKRILVALLDGPMKGDVLARAVNLANRSSLYGTASAQSDTGPGTGTGDRIKRGGVEELMRLGLVRVDEELGYILNDSGREVATEIQEN